MNNFDLTKEQRAKLLDILVLELEKYYSNTAELSVTPSLNIEEIKMAVRKANFNKPMDINDAVRTVLDFLTKYSVHTTHPRYFGLFNPRPNFPSIIADLITATYNPQLAAWSHSPYASEVESFLIKEFGLKFGFPASEIDGTFATGGTEANITAILCALNHSFPEFANEGIYSIKQRLSIYCSSEAHHSLTRAVMASGLGVKSLRIIPVNEKLMIRTDILERTITSDLSEGYYPLMIIGTAGTTGTGSIDDLHKLASIAKNYKLWYHIDSAWGGAAIMNNITKTWIKGIEYADSLTFDVHKWLSVPMSASLFITQHRDILGKTFRISTEYMPKDAENLEINDQYKHSIQWSRRFIGLKLYLSMMIFGWEGYSEIIWHQVEMGELLRKVLKENSWLVVNSTPLPLVCFTDDIYKSDPFFAKTICENIIKSGKAWISLYPINELNTLRVCITNYNTRHDDIYAFVNMINRLRSELFASK
jgi:glutamate/tyrosine decarboxylase-like PLP-dependent enzyme